MNKHLLNICNLVQGKIKKHKSDNVCRQRITTMNDGILFRLLYSEGDQTQNKITAIMNRAKGTTTDRSSYVDREAKIDLTFYKELGGLISTYFDQNVASSYTRQVIAIDGTITNFSAKLATDGFKLNKNAETISPLVAGAYNVTYNYPMALDLVAHKNERAAFLEFHRNTIMFDNNCESFKNSIFIFDRGYSGYKFFGKLENKDISFICRIQMNSNMIDKNINDHNTTYDYGRKI